MARIFDVLTDNISGTDQEVSYRERKLIAPKNHRSFAEYSTFHTPLGDGLSPDALSFSSAQADLVALAPTKDTARLAGRLLSSKSTLSTLISQPFQYSYWLLMGLFLTACSGSGGGGGDLPADPASIDLPIGNIDIEFTGEPLTFSKEFNNAYLEAENNRSEDAPATEATSNLELPIQFSADQPIDFQATLLYEVTRINPLNVSETLEYRHEDAISDNGDAFPFFALIETNGSGILLANHRYDFDSDRGPDYTIKLIAFSDSGQRYDSIDITIRGVDNADEGPVFIGGDDGFAFTVEENVASIEEITTIRAIPDIQGYDVTYSLDQKSIDLGFNIDPNSGLLSYDDPNNLGFDYETLPRDNENNIIADITLTVTATDEVENSTTQNVTITIQNIDLTITSADEIEIAEDSTGVLHTFTATPDERNDTITYTLVDGDNDNGFFALQTAIDSDTGFEIANLVLKSDHRFDADGEDPKTEYILDVVVKTFNADNVEGANPVQQRFTITITDVNDNAPVFAVTDESDDVATDSITIAENSTGVIHTFVATPDVDDENADNYQAEVYSFVTLQDGDGNDIANDNDLFELNTSTGDVTLASGTTLDHESGKTSYRLDVSATAGNSPVAMQTLTITITDEAETAPVFAVTDSSADNATDSITIAENSTGVIHTFTATPDVDDVNADNYQAVEYSFVTLQDGDGIDIVNDNDLFDLDSATGALTLKDDAVLDYEAGDTRTVVVSAADGIDNTLVSTQTLTITLTDEAETPPVFAVTDNSADNATDSKEIVENFTGDANGVIHTFTATPDVSGTILTYGFVTLQDGDGNDIANDNDLFELDAATGAVTLASGTTLDHESGKTSYRLDVSATDDSNAPLDPLVSTQTLTINLTDVNEGPTFDTQDGSADRSTDSRTIDENSTGDANGVIHTFIATPDLDDGSNISYSFVTLQDGDGNDIANDNDLFELNTSTGAVTLASGTTFDHESGKTSYRLDVSATDDSNAPLDPLVSTQTLTINLNDVNDNPPSIALFDLDGTALTNANLSPDDMLNVRINEDLTTDEAILIVRATPDVDGDTISFSTDSGYFEVKEQDGEYKLFLTLDGQGRADKDINIEDIIAHDSVAITATVGDQSIATQLIRITYDAVDDRPTAITITPIAGEGEWAENTPTEERPLADITVTDQDANNHVLQVSDTDLFEIRDNNALWLKAGVTLDYETDQTREVTVSAIDGIDSVTASFTLTITNTADSAPSFGGEATATTDENNADFSHALPFTADLEGTVTLSLAEGVGDNDLFDITTDDDGNHYLVVKTLTDESTEDAAARVLDNEAAQTRTVTVTATDDDAPSLVTEQEITITITNINEGPLFELPQASVTIDETHEAFDQTNNTAPAILTGFTGTADIGTGEVFFRVTGDYADHFTMSDRQLFLTDAGRALIDQEADNAQSSFDVEITARVGNDTDNVTTRTLTINVTDAHDAAPDFTLSDFSINEDLTVDDALLAAPLSAIADGTGATLSFTISGTDAANFTIGNDNNLYLTDAGVTALATASSFNITVTATSELNGVSHSTEQTVTITKSGLSLSVNQTGASFVEGVALVADQDLATFTLNSAYDGATDSYEVLDTNGNVILDNRFDININVDAANNTTIFTLFAFAGSVFDSGNDGDIQGSLRVMVGDVPVTSDLVTVSITSEDNSYIADDTQETFDGRAGSDTLSYANSDEAVTVELNGTTDADGFITASGGYAEGDLIKNIENFIGSAFDDTITGDAEDNIIEGGAGADTLHGGAGNDTVSYASSDAGVNVNLGGTTGTYFNIDYIVGHSGGHAEGDRLLNFENILGSDHDDTLTGDSGVNILEGAGGSDTLTGNGGNDVFVAHSADGDTDTITDFTSGDKIRVDVADPSSINNLASLFGTLSISQATSNSGVTLTFDRGASDYMIVLDGFSGNLTFTDFEVI